MARTEARIKCAIWKDDDYRSLTLEAQWLYTAILSQQDLTLCGVLTWTPKRFAKLASNASAAAAKKALDHLRSKRYVVVDEETDELWVRTFAKNDGVVDSPNLILAMSHDFGAIHSSTIREGLVEGLGEGFLEGLPQRFKKPLPQGFMERLAGPFVEALGRPRAGAGAPPLSCVPQVPSAPVPHAPPDEHKSSSSLDRVGERPAEEEENDRGSWDGLLVARLVAKRRLGKLSDPPPEGFRRDRWLTRTAENLLADEHGSIAHHLITLPVEAVVDLFEPPDQPAAAVPSPYPEAGHATEPAWDLDDDGLAVARVAP